MRPSITRLPKEPKWISSEKPEEKLGKWPRLGHKMAVRLLLLFPLLVFCSTQVIPGQEEHWWTQPLENFGFRVFRPSSFSQHPWTSPQVTSEDSNRFTLKKFRPTKRFDEAQIIEALAPDDETGTRSEEEVETPRQSLAEDFKLLTRLKRTEMENLSGAGKEYITRLGKRSWTFQHWTDGWHQSCIMSQIRQIYLCKFFGCPG